MPARRSTLIGVVVALAVSLLGPSVAVALRDHSQAAAAGSALNWVSLITGDQVAIDAAGSVVAIHPATGRERISLTLQQTGDHLYVVPADAADPISRGLVDRRLFDVALLSRPEYQWQNSAGLAIIVTYRDRRRPLSAGGVRVEHLYTSINGEALTVTAPAAAWSRLTGDPSVKKIWLDAVPADLSNQRGGEIRTS
ncbi:hypothetical protein AB0P21_12020 [Kribbella sp. NPDC056861]|uniref:hypothetical protein n=1 Tax=Kribbella sp. NPDC056861 TaxID=3154857 RepID=UPI00342D1F87